MPLFFLVSLGLGLQEEVDLEELKARLKKDLDKVESETEHFVIESYAGKEVSERSQKIMESYFAQFMKVMAPPSAPAEKIRIAIHRNPEAYEKEGGVKGTNATYVPSDRRIAALDDPELYQFLGREAACAFIHGAFPNLFAGKTGGTWLLAGLSEYFGGAETPGESVVLDNPLSTGNSLNIFSVQRLIRDRKDIPLEKLAKMPLQEYAKRAKVLNLQSWSLVYFLLNGGPYRDRVPILIKTLEEGKAIAEALTVNGKKVDISSLQTPWSDYFKKLKAAAPNREEEEWHVGETEHYLVRVQKGTQNVKTKATDKQVLEDMKFKMELLFEKYALAFGFEGRLKRKAQMRLYKDKNAYHRAGGPGGSAAYYSPATKELVGYEDSAETGIVFQIFCHEGCHQFFDLAFPGFYSSEDLPMWFSEGLADCFGSSEIVGKNLQVFTLNGVASWRLETVKEAANTKQNPHFRDLVEQGRGEFMSNAGMNYAISWSFCHFLWNYPDLISPKGGTYKEIMVRLINGFKEGRPKDEVYREAFALKGKPLDLDVLEGQWREYVRKLKIFKPVKK